MFQTRVNKSIAIVLSVIVLFVAGYVASSMSKKGPDQPPQAAAEKNPATTMKPAVTGAADIRKAATDIPAPIGIREPQRIVEKLTSIELDGVLEDGSTYTYWTFNGTVPGPMLRVRVGDTVELHLENDSSSHNVHSIDLHAVTGPGGGAVATQVVPGETRAFVFEAKHPGVYVYHCATPHIPTHITNGMYGLIVVEPEEGLAPVDKEFYIMQGEIYTKHARSEKGHHAFDGQRMLDENPTYVVFNGAVNALTEDMAMEAEVGDKVRLFIGNGGPNLSSSFHVIGEIMDKVHQEGATEPVSNIQTTFIPAGGAAWAEFTVDVPGDYILVDHALSRSINKGAIGILTVTGPENPVVYEDLGVQ